ncbi:hypothetical protein Cni_G06780 [Canna indica]|uniref:Reverse transcriptase zinc-binding domain-containing protein n=1 Tax=Canna indica TaxID=4628 RepID=A0AAQ3JZ86_9LILI|nr:hypothetical protein Cni_G06780 [Canna indica]
MWRRSCPEAISVMSWLVMNQRLPTKDRLIARGILVDPRCSLCESKDETLNHLLSKCHFTTKGWDLLLNLSNITLFPLSFHPWLGPINGGSSTHAQRCCSSFASS